MDTYPAHFSHYRNRRIPGLPEISQQPIISLNLRKQLESSFTSSKYLTVFARFHSHLKRLSEKAFLFNSYPLLFEPCDMRNILGLVCTLVLVVVLVSAQGGTSAGRPLPRINDESVVCASQLFIFLLFTRALLLNVGHLSVLAE